MPQLEIPSEQSIEPIDVESFRVPGSPVGKDKGKTTVVEGINPNTNPRTFESKEDEDEDINFCVASVKKSDLEKID